MAAAIQAIEYWYRESVEDQSVTGADALRVAMKDALQPVAELLATMPSMNKPERKAELKNVATQAIGAIRLLLDNVDRLRVVVYEITNEEGRMDRLCYGGRSGSLRSRSFPARRGVMLPSRWFGRDVRCSR